MGTGLVGSGEQQVNLPTTIPSTGDGVVGAQADPVVTATTDGGFYVVYESPVQGTTDINLLYQIYTANGGRSQNFSFAVDNSLDVTVHPAITATANSFTFAVAYSDVTAGTIDVRTVNLISGTSSPFTVDGVINHLPNTHALDNPAIAAFADGNLLIAYEQVLSATDHDVDAAILNPSATAFVSPVRSIASSNAFEGESRVATFGNTGALVFARDPGTIGGGQDIVLLFYNSTGTEIASPTTVFGTNSSDVWSHPDVAALSDGRFVVVAQDDTTGGIAAAICDPTTHTVTPVLSLSGSTNPHVAGLPGDGFVVTFESGGNVFEIRGGAGGILQQSGLVESFTAGTQDENAVAANASGTVLFAWQDTGSGNPYSTDTDTRIESQAFQVVYTRSDVLLRSTGGALFDWTMNGPQIGAAQVLTFMGNPIVLGPSFDDAGTGDFNGDGAADILLRSNTSGTFVTWTMSGSQITAAQYVSVGATPVSLDPSWNVAGVGDFNGDTKADILLRNSNGTFVGWTMNGSQITAAQFVSVGATPVTLDPSWSVAGVADFNGDGKADILLRNTSGTFVTWTMSGSQITAAQYVSVGATPVSLDSSWSIVGTGDFNGDGKADILLRNTNGTFVDWTMSGSQITAAQFVSVGATPVSLDQSWSIVEVGDFNADGKADILLRNTNGPLVDWTMNGSQITAAQLVSVGATPVTLPDQYQTETNPATSGVGTRIASGAINSPVISGGTLDLTSGAIVTGPISFAAGSTGTLFDADQASLPDTVMGFSEGADYLRFAGETAANIASVVASAQTIGGNTTLTFPDHTSITLVGITHVDAGFFA